MRQSWLIKKQEMHYHKIVSSTSLQNQINSMSFKKKIFSVNLSHLVIQQLYDPKIYKIIYILYKHLLYLSIFVFKIYLLT